VSSSVFTQLFLLKTFIYILILVKYLKKSENVNKILPKGGRKRFLIIEKNSRCDGVMDLSPGSVIICIVAAVYPPHPPLSPTLSPQHDNHPELTIATLFAWMLTMRNQTS
jgi:hypothetical protein